MKRSNAAFLMILCIVLLNTACAPVKPADQQAGLLYIEGTVRSLAGQEVTIEMKLPEFAKVTESFVADIARQVVQKTLFLDGIKTEVNGASATVKEVRGVTVILVLEKPQPYSVGMTAQIRIPRKTIAVMDFEVIRGNKKEIGRATLEDLTSALINSGHFIVVERSKLKTVLDEQALSLTGLTKEPAEKLIGTLLTADLVLTGTLAEVGSGAWDINLRLVNVRTGQAMSAIAMRTTLFKPQELRDAGPIDEDFETDSVDASWRTGYRKKGLYHVGLDASQGAEGSRHSLKMDFDFTGKAAAPNASKGGDQTGAVEEPTFARMENGKKRDLWLYTGIEFFVRSDQPLTGKLNILTSNPEDINKIDAWAAAFDISTEWKRIRIPFDSMSVGRRWIKQGAVKAGARPGDQVMRLDRVESVRIGVDSDWIPPVHGMVWIDKVRCYRD